MSATSIVTVTYCELHLTIYLLDNVAQLHWAKPT